MNLVLELIKKKITGTSTTSFYRLNLLGNGKKSMTVSARIKGQLNLNNNELFISQDTIYKDTAANIGIIGSLIYQN